MKNNGFIVFVYACIVILLATNYFFRIANKRGQALCDDIVTLTEELKAEVIKNQKLLFRLKSTYERLSLEKLQDDCTICYGTGKVICEVCRGRGRRSLNVASLGLSNGYQYIISSEFNGYALVSDDKIKTDCFFCEARGYKKCPHLMP